MLITHIGLLMWETRYVSMSLAFPGLKPRAIRLRPQERARSTTHVHEHQGGWRSVILGLEFPPISHLIEWPDIFFKDTAFAVNKVVLIDVGLGAPRDRLVHRR